MAGFRNFDTSGNESQYTVLSKIRSMLRELFGGTAAGNFASLQLGTGTKTATATAGAATLDQPAGVITSEALTTAQDASYTLTITNSEIAATDVVLASLANGTNTQGTPVIGRVTPADGSVVIVVHNKHATAQALNGTLKIAFAVIK
jgi:hypothetical protein